MLQTTSTSTGRPVGTPRRKSPIRVGTACVMLALAWTPLLVSCKGPKHLSTHDFDTGRRAFEALEHKREAIDQDDSGAADRWEKLYRSKLIREVGLNSPAIDALLDYDFSISLKSLTRSELNTARIDQESARSSPGERAGARQKYEKLAGRYPDVETVVRLCRDDAAAYFVAGVPATNTCAQRLAPLKAAYHAEHPKQ